MAKNMIKFSALPLIVIVSFIVFRIIAIETKPTATEAPRHSQETEFPSFLNTSRQSLTQSAPEVIEPNPLGFEVHEVLRKHGYLVSDEGTNSSLSCIRWINQSSSHIIDGWAEGRGTGILYRRLLKLKMTEKGKFGWEADRIRVLNGQLQIHDGIAWTTPIIKRSLAETLDLITMSGRRIDVELALDQMTFPDDFSKTLDDIIDHFSDKLGKSESIIMKLTYEELCRELKERLGENEARTHDLELPRSLLNSTPKDQKDLLKIWKKRKRNDELSDAEIDRVYSILQKTKMP
jgi:hypothetical protein